jgi:outer membrane lipoprotein carrier protein
MYFGLFIENEAPLRYDMILKNMRNFMSFIRIFMIFFPIILFSEIKIPVSFSATFVQKVTTPKKKMIQYSGNLRLNRSREFRWAYRTPTTREICGDGSQVRIIDHKLEQVVIYKVGSLLDLMQLLKRAKPYRNDIYLAKYHGTRYTLKVNPKGQLEQIAYKDKMDNVINIHFHKIQYNTVPFSASRLKCVAPKSYDIIKG